MTNDTPRPEKITNLREQLAAIEHDRWAGWQRYLHSKLMQRVMKYEDWEHWERQINTPYAELSESEKNSDREQVGRYLPFLADWVRSKKPECHFSLEHSQVAATMKLDDYEQALLADLEANEPTKD